MPQVRLLPLLLLLQDHATSRPNVGDAEVHRARSRSASVARGNKAGLWQEEAKPRRRGKPKPLPSRAHAEFPLLLDAWLYARGLTGALYRNVTQEAAEQRAHVLGKELGLRRWFIYDYVNAQDVPPHWVPAYHGTWWYALWSLIESGVLLESNDRALGHDFWEYPAHEDSSLVCSPSCPLQRWGLPSGSSRVACGCEPS
eukprot:135633-Amphidinium_carterae.7